MGTPSAETVCELQIVTGTSSMIALYTIGADRGLFSLVCALGSVLFLYDVLYAAPHLRIPVSASACILLLGCAAALPLPAPQEPVRGVAASPGMIFRALALEDASYVDSRLIRCSVRVIGIEDAARHLVQRGDFGRIEIMGRTEAMLLWGEELCFHIRGSSESGVFYTEALTGTGSYAGPRWFFSFRGMLYEQILGLCARVPQEQGELIRMLVLGDTGDPDAPIIRQFRASGCSHLLALSGMHVFVITWIISRIISCFLPPLVSRVVICSGLTAFLLLAGLQPSLVRAGLMYLIVTLSAILFHRRLSPLKVLALTCLIQMLLFLPQVRSAGFLLSYGAMFGILLSSDTVASWFPPAVPRMLSTPVAASVAAVIMTFPVLSQTFGEIYPAGIIASVFLTPAVIAYMAVSLLFLSTGFSPCLLQLVSVCFRVLYRYLDTVSSLFGRLPPCSTGVLSAVSFQTGMLVIMAIRFALKYGRIAHNRKRNRQYEQCLSLRFTERNTTTA